MSMAVAMLTTIDNPYDPFVQFEEWYAFDTGKGYNSCSYLDRIANTSNDLSDTEYNAHIEQAIDEIVELDLLGLYKKVILEP